MDGNAIPKTPKVPAVLVALPLPTYRELRLAAARANCTPTGLTRAWIYEKLGEVARDAQPA